MTEKHTAKIITRFPPSPTGFLHIGRARTALFNYLFTQKNKGEMVFRIEDTDKERSKKEFEESMIETLHWLGIGYDKGPFRQSERTELYKKYLHEMIDSGHAYLSMEPPSQGFGEPREVVRFKNPNKKITFTDLVRGEIEFDTTDLKDFVIARNINEPLYHLAVVVDDFEMGITHVIRGEDGISNTPRQILIQEAIGAPRPIYAHIPLILAPDKSKLSGRHGAVSVTDYRDQGYLPEAITNYLALLGWNPGTEQEIFTKEELIEQFDLSKVQKGGAVFDLVKLKWVNREHMLKLPFEIFKEETLEWMSEKIRSAETFEERIDKVIPIIRDRISVYGEIGEIEKEGELDYFFFTPEYKKENLVCPEKLRKNLTVTLDDVMERLKEVIGMLEKIPDEDFSDPEKIKSALWDYATEHGRGVVLWAMRYALSGKEKSPDPFTLASILGKNETIVRLRV